jgi:hypothetical protein
MHYNTGLLQQDDVAGVSPDAGDMFVADEVDGVAGARVLRNRPGSSSSSSSSAVTSK